MLVMTLLVRDEEDILDAHIAYHLAQGVDLVVVTDNRSVDATPEILERWEATGRVRALREDDDDYDQSAWVTRMAALAIDEHGADWVIHSDADEFWWPTWGDLPGALASLAPDAGLLRAPRVNFVPTANEAGPFHRRMVVRETHSRNAVGQSLPPKVAHRAAPGVVVEQGNHDLRAPTLTAHQGPSPIVILHFPLRAYRRFQDRIVSGGQAYARNDKVAPDVGGTWRELYRLWQRGELPEWYRRQCLSHRRTAAGIRHGDLVVDRRLDQFLASQEITALESSGRRPTLDGSARRRWPWTRWAQRAS